MAAGIQTWDGNGRLRMDTSTRITRIIGWRYVGIDYGTFLDAALAAAVAAGGVPFAFCISNQPTTQLSTQAVAICDGGGQVSFGPAIAQNNEFVAGGSQMLIYFGVY